MKKLLCITLILVLVLSLAGCKGTPSSVNGDPLQATSSTDDSSIESKIEEKIEDNDEAPYREIGVSQGLLYEVRGGRSTVYLFGTIHVGTKEMYPLIDSVETIIAKADVLALEIDLDDVSPIQLSQIVSEYGMLKDGSVLSDHLPKETFDTLLSLLRPMGLNRQALDLFKPWYISLLLAQVAMTEAGLSSGHGVEEYIKSRFTGEEIIGLETFESQIKIFDMLTIEDGIDMIEQGLKELESSIDELEELLFMWINGDEEGFAETRATQFEGEMTETVKEYTHALTKGRDAKMADKIEGFLRDRRERVYFVAVGTLHLVGEDSINDVLSKKGYEVVRIR